MAITTGGQESYQNLSLHQSDSQIGVREGEVEVNLPTDGLGEEDHQQELDQARNVLFSVWSFESLRLSGKIHIVLVVHHDRPLKIPSSL